MFFCDFDLKNESFESNGRIAKVYDKKKEHARRHAPEEKTVKNQVTGAGLNTASWLCNPH